MATVPDDSFVLAGLNLHGGRDDNGVPYDVEAACRSLDADIVLLQEAWRNDEEDELQRYAKECGSRLLRHDLLPETSLDSLGILLGAHEKGAWGLAVLTSLAVAHYEVIELGTARGDMSPRAAQAVTVKTRAGRQVRVVNTHLTYRLMKSPLQLCALMRALEREDVPTVVVGDLNMAGPVAVWASGRRRAVRGRTWPARRPVAQLDHVLFGPGVEILSGEVRRAVGTDHLPVRGRLRLV